MVVSIGEYKQAVEALAQRMKAFYDRGVIDIEKEWQKNYVRGSKFANEIEALAQETNQEINDKFVERFCHKAVITLMLKFLFLRFAEDRKILSSYFRDEAIEKWQRGNKEVQKIIREAFEEAREKFKGLYKTTVYDEFSPSETTLKTYLIDALSDEPKSGLYSGKGSLDFATLDPRVISAFYEKLFKRKRRKELGLFFTPPVIAEYLIEKAFEEQKITRDFLILDPACGSGQILLAAYRKLKDIFVNQLRMTPGEAHKQILSCNLWGVDIEPFAVLLSKINLALQDLINVPEYINIIHGDSLLEIGFDIPQMAMLKDVGEKQKQKVIKETVQTRGGKEITFWRNGFGRIFFEKPIEQKVLFELVERMKTSIFSEESGIRTMKDLPKEFNAVITNPPYVFTRKAGFSIEKKHSYANKFATGLGKINLFSLFIEFGIKKLKKEGILSYVLHSTFLRASPYRFIRSYVLNNSKLKMITNIGSGFFEDTTGEVITMVLQKSKDLKNEVTIVNDINRDIRHKIPQKSFQENINYVFNIFSDPIVEKILLKLNNIGQPLGTIKKRLIAGIQTKRDKSRYIANYPVNPKYKKLLEGKDIGRYRLSFKNKYIIYDKKKLHVAQDESIFLSPIKILIQRIGGGINPLVATLDPEQYYIFNSINSLIILSPQFDHKYILTLLNSKLLSFYFNAKFTNFAHFTVNISRSYLNQLPIYPATPQQQKPFIKMADKMLELNKKLQETEKDFYKITEDKIKNKIPLRKIEGLDFVNIKDSHAKLGDKGIIGAKQKDNTVVVAINKRPTVKIVCRYEVAAEFLMKYLNDLRTNILSGKDGYSWIERVLNTKINWDKKSNLEKILNQYKALQSSVEQFKKEIDETDKKINERIYDLYGITKEERKIIEKLMV